MTKNGSVLMQNTGGSCYTICFYFSLHSIFDLTIQNNTSPEGDYKCYIIDEAGITMEKDADLLQLPQQRKQ